MTTTMNPSVSRFIRRKAERPGWRRYRAVHPLVMVMAISCGGQSLASAQTAFREGDVVTPNPVSGRDPNAIEQITPADCLARVRLLSYEIDEIRRIMGKPKSKTLELGIENSQPHDVLYQALTLYRKTDRLAFENVRTSHDAPITKSKAIRPMHVWKILDASLKRTLHVKRHLGITAEFAEMRMPETTVPSDVFLAIVQTNRQLNRLLTREFAPANVYQQVTVAVHIASRLLEPFGQSVATIEAPAFEEAKIPAHVYERLLACYEQIRRIGIASDIEVLTLTLGDGAVEGVTPSDVYDVASLIVAELAYLHSRVSGAKPPEQAYYPGIKFPSHVFQRAGLLQRQLEALGRCASRSRDWIN